MRQVSVNNNIVRILIDNGGKERVCGVKQPSQAHPYNSQLISVKETALCSVTN